MGKKIKPESSSKDFNDFYEIDEQGDIFKQMYTYSVIPTIIHDMEMNILDVNDRAVEEFGYSRNDLLKKSILDLHTKDQGEHFKDVLNDLRQKEKSSAEISFKRKDGSEFLAEVTPCKFLLGKKPVIHLFIQDITERKRAELELKENIRQLAEKNKALEEFTYVTSHDLQEPLNSIIAWSSLLKNKYYEMLDETGQKSITMIEKSSYRMKDFIVCLLEYIRVGRQHEKREVKINTLVKNLKVDLAALIEKENPIINYTENGIAVMAYEPELVKLFQNILTNAIKFRKKDVDPVITITATELEDCYEFSVSDNGIGIAKEHYEKIFGIFQRLHERDKYEGTGIGLSHSKKIVELHQGNIWVQSEVGVGTNFYFTISK